MDLNHPLVQSVVVPTLLALVLAGGLRRRLGAGKRYYACAAGIALLVAALLILGEPAWPPRSALHKLPLVFLALTLAGVVLDARFSACFSAWHTTFATGFIVIAVVSPWLAWTQLEGSGPGVLWLVIAAAIPGLVALIALGDAPAAGAHRPGMLAVCALALAGASLNAGSLVLFQLALALAAAVAGYAVWTWPRPRLLFTDGAVLAVGGACHALVLSTLLLTGIRAWALLPLLLVFAGSRLARRLPVPSWTRREVAEPLYIAAAGLIPAIATVLLSHPPVAIDDPYYG